MQFWPARMKELRRLILEEQQKVLKKSVPCAFVTFRQASKTSIMHECTLRWNTSFDSQIPPAWYVTLP
jgi:hypothetical protein